jgi:hypothetical protein
MPMQGQTAVPMAMQQHGGRIKHVDRTEPRDGGRDERPAQPIGDDQADAGMARLNSN